jgi:hypothetical protein
MQMYKREIKYKIAWGDLEIIRHSWCQIVFYILVAMFWKLLEETNKYALNFFLPLEKLLDLPINFLDSSSWSKQLLEELK